jgi:uncharacterized membrane protein YqhA
MGNMKKIARAFESAVLLSRWVLAPFLVGLALAMFLLMFRFFGDLCQLAMRLPDSTWHQLSSASST